MCDVLPVVLLILFNLQRVVDIMPILFALAIFPSVKPYKEISFFNKKIKDRILGLIYLVEGLIYQ